MALQRKCRRHFNLSKANHWVCGLIRLIAVLNMKYSCYFSGEVAVYAIHSMVIDLLHFENQITMFSVQMNVFSKQLINNNFSDLFLTFPLWVAMVVKGRVLAFMLFD